METLSHEDEIITMLRSLWSPARIVRYLRFRYGDEGVTASDIKRVKDLMASESFITPSRLAQRGDVQVDTLMAMSRLLLEQEEMVAAATLVAEVNPHESGAQRAAAALIKQYWNMLTEFAEVMQSVGELPRIGVKPGEEGERLPVTQQTVVLLGDLKPKQLEISGPAQAALSPLEDARRAGLIVEGEYEEVVGRSEGTSLGNPARALPSRGD